MGRFVNFLVFFAMVAGVVVILRTYTEGWVRFLLFIVAMFLTLIGFAFSHRSPRSSSGFARKPPSLQRIPDSLLLACLHDVDKANRLAAYEMERAPGISGAEARKRAYERLVRDLNA